ncbi:transferase [Metarhizium brunneum]
MPIMFRKKRSGLLLLASNLMIPLGMLIFMTGLFRSRPRVAQGGDETMHRPAPSPYRHNAPPFDKVIFMVVDALRRQVCSCRSPAWRISTTDSGGDSDFVFAQESGFPFTQSLIRSGAAIPFTALAAMPTLTVSRIKALTQGSSQSFLDAWLNVANSPEAMRLDGEDTWLSRLKASRQDKNKIVFYGIEMWVDLYPDVFDRKEDFSSFHVPGLTNVDTNVTRHLPEELARDDWAALVLHYLGLDCIAHMGGPRSAHMRPKQLEMDAVVESIYRTLETAVHMERTLLVLLGDHGMTAQGNHGGRLPEELAAATVFISPRLQGTTSTRRDSPPAVAQDYLYYSTVHQIDIVPSLSGLLGFSIPERNAGIFIPELLSAMGDDDAATDFLVENARQLRGALASSKHDIASHASSSGDASYTDCEAHSSEFGRAMCLWDAVLEAEKDWQTAPGDEARGMLKSVIYEFAKVAQKLLSISVDNVSLGRLLIGIAFLMTAVAFTCMSFISLDLTRWPLFAATATHAATMFIPWLVEEEHHYWYWGSLAWLVYLASTRARGPDRAVIPFVGLVALQFLSQCVNQNGTKYSIAERMDDFIFRNPVALWIPVLLSHTSALMSIAQNLRAGLGRHAAFGAALALCAAAVVFKLSSTHDFNPELLGFASHHAQHFMATLRQDRLLKAFWTGLLSCLVYYLLHHRFGDNPSPSDTISKVVELFNLYLRSQTRPKNLPLFLMFDCQLQVLMKMNPSPIETATTVLLLGQSAFYSMGRSNSIATLDLLNGFNGLGESSVVGVMLQTVLSNWVGPVWWLFAGLRLLASWAETKQEPFTGTQNGDAASSRGVQSTSKRLLKWQESEAKIHRGDTHTPATSEAKANGTMKAGAEAGESPYFEYLALHTMFSGLSSLVLTLACLCTWGHENLWDVFAPKFINASLWAFFHQFLMNCLGCSCLWFLINGRG